MIDFDEIDTWEDQLGAVLEKYVTNETKNKIHSSQLECFDCAGKFLLELIDKNKAIDDILLWLKNSIVIGYHGSRLTDEEFVSIKENGILPLSSDSRTERIKQILAENKMWSIDGLKKTVHKFGKECYNGNRDGQVHLTLSKAGLKNFFNEYLLYGSEFDRRVICSLLGKDTGYSLLKKYGKTRLIKVAISGNDALKATHKHIGIDMMRKRNDVPNIVKPLLDVWTFRLIKKEFDPKTYDLNCGMIFDEKIPTSWIINADTLNMDK